MAVAMGEFTCLLFGRRGQWLYAGNQKSTSWKERAEEIGSTAAWRCHALYIALHLPKHPTAEHIIACNCYLHTSITQQ